MSGTLRQDACLGILNINAIHKVEEDQDVYKRLDIGPITIINADGTQSIHPRLHFLRTSFWRFSSQKIIPCKGVLFDFSFVVADSKHPDGYSPAPASMIENLDFEINDSASHGSACVRESIARKNRDAASAVERLGCSCVDMKMRIVKTDPRKAGAAPFEYVPTAVTA